MRSHTLESIVNCIKHFSGLSLKMAVYEELKHIAIKMI